MAGGSWSACCCCDTDPKAITRRRRSVGRSAGQLRATGLGPETDAFQAATPRAPPPAPEPDRPRSISISWSAPLGNHARVICSRVLSPTTGIKPVQSRTHYFITVTTLTRSMQSTERVAVSPLLTRTAKKKKLRYAAVYDPGHDGRRRKSRIYTAAVPL